MATNSSELMRLMVIRNPEPKAEQPAIALAPSDEVMRAPAPFQKAREFLGKMLVESNRRIVDPAQVRSQPQLAALRANASETGSDGQSPGALVEEVFAKPADKVITPADWSSALHKLSDSILFYKLAYRGGPRPLAELTDLYRAMVAVGRVAEGAITDMKGLRAALDAPLRLPPPFARADANRTGRIEARRAQAVETVLTRVRKATELYEQEQSIQKAIDELVEVPIEPNKFTTVSLGLRVAPRNADAPSKAPVQRGTSEAEEDLLAMNWALRREALKAGATDIGLAPSRVGLALTPDAVRTLSADTRKLATAAGVDPTRDSIERVAAALVVKRAAVRTNREALMRTDTSVQSRTLGGISVSKVVRPRDSSQESPISLPAGVRIPEGINLDWDNLLVDSGWPGETPDAGVGPDPDLDLGPSLLLPAGVGQLYIIRQQIIGYRSGEISHVENVLPGETRERQHRRLKQQEISTTEEHEREQEDEKSLQTTSRSELEREVQSTIKRQFNAGASAQVSADYGKVEFAASGQVQVATASESASKTAQRVASEVIETSRQRVTERVRTERSQKTLEELEETNLHKFSGEEFTEPFVGVYQWIDKIYLNEVWSYGLRTMYEVIAPEPGAALIAAAMTPGAAEPGLVEKPPPLTVPIAQLDPAKVHKLCVAYGVTEVIEPFPEPVLINVAFAASSDKDAHDNFYAEAKEVEVPDGYEPVDGWIVVRARGEDQTPMIGVTIGRASGGFHTDNLVLNSTINNIPIFFTCDSWPSTANIEKLQAAVAADDYSSFAVSVLIRLRPSAARIDKWKRHAFSAIRGAYDARLGEWRDYQSQVDFEKPELSERLLAGNPGANRQLARQELQRSAMEIFRNLSMDFDLLREGSSVHAIPRIDFPSLVEASPEILFLSQAFEWHNMTFVLYPYFFGRRPEWPMKMLLEGVDSDFVEFLKSGAARVQVPVRPGWEAAVDHYMMTREPFFGQGLPQIGDDLYLPYVDEARDAGGAALGGEHVGELDFEVTVPTTLVVARNGKKIDVASGTLPRWIKTGEHWEEA